MATTESCTPTARPARPGGRVGHPLFPPEFPRVLSAGTRRRWSLPVPPEHPRWRPTPARVTTRVSRGGRVSPVAAVRALAICQAPTEPSPQHQGRSLGAVGWFVCAGKPTRRFPLQTGERYYEPPVSEQTRARACIKGHAITLASYGRSGLPISRGTLRFSRHRLWASWPVDERTPGSFTPEPLSGVDPVEPLEEQQSLLGPRMGARVNRTALPRAVGWLARRISDSAYRPHFSELQATGSLWAPCRRIFSSPSYTSRHLVRGPCGCRCSCVPFYFPKKDFVWEIEKSSPRPPNPPGGLHISREHHHCPPPPPTPAARTLYFIHFPTTTNTRYTHSLFITNY